MHHTTKELRKIILNNFNRQRCKQCRYYRKDKQFDFCMLLHPNENDCIVIKEELNLVGTKQ